MAIQHSTNSTSLGDLLERILDKGIVIAGDIKISLADVELLNIKIRLLVASVDKAKELGINWWANDPYLSSGARAAKQITTEDNEQVHIQADKMEEDSGVIIEEAEPLASVEKEPEVVETIPSNKTVIKRPKYRN